MLFTLASRIWKNILRYMINPETPWNSSIPGKFKGYYGTQQSLGGSLEKHQGKKKLFFLCETLSVFHTSQAGQTNASYTVMEKGRSAEGWVVSITYL